LGVHAARYYLLEIGAPNTDDGIGRAVPARDLDVAIGNSHIPVLYIFAIDIFAIDIFAIDIFAIDIFAIADVESNRRRLPLERGEMNRLGQDGKEFAYRVSGCLR